MRTGLLSRLKSIPLSGTPADASDLAAGSTDLAADLSDIAAGTSGLAANASGPAVAVLDITETAQGPAGASPGLAATSVRIRIQIM